MSAVQLQRLFGTKTIHRSFDCQETEGTNFVTRLYRMLLSRDVTISRLKKGCPMAPEIFLSKFDNFTTNRNYYKQNSKIFLSIHNIYMWIKDHIFQWTTLKHHNVNLYTYCNSYVVRDTYYARYWCAQLSKKASQNPVSNKQTWYFRNSRYIPRWIQSVKRAYVLFSRIPVMMLCLSFYKLSCGCGIFCAEPHDRIEQLIYRYRSTITIDMTVISCGKVHA